MVHKVRIILGFSARSLSLHEFTNFAWSLQTKYRKKHGKGQPWQRRHFGLPFIICWNVVQLLNISLCAKTMDSNRNYIETNSRALVEQMDFDVRVSSTVYLCLITIKHKRKLQVNCRIQLQNKLWKEDPVDRHQHVGCLIPEHVWHLIEENEKWQASLLRGSVRCQKDTRELVESKSFTKVAVTIVSMFSCRSMVFYVPMCLVHSMGHILQLKVRAAGPKTSAQDCSTNLYYLVIGVSK